MNTNDRIRGIVRKIADKNALTVREMATRAAMNPNTLSNFLNENSGFSLDNADKLLHSLGLEIGIRRIQAGEG